MLGQLPLAPGRRKSLILAVDYFTKWAEARPLATITAGQMISFIWEQIVCRHGLPRVLITDNARQFDNADLRAFCQGNRIDHRFASVAHPQRNGQVEVTNRTLLQALKKRLTDAEGSWADILFSYEFYLLEVELERHSLFASHRHQH